jgi:putative component of membrane protein insertase Oxa1/YidC/SpoIIIJ protein YidD
MRRAALVAAVAVATACSAPSRPSPCEPAPAFAPWDAVAPASEHRVDPPEGAADGLLAIYQRHLRRPALPGEGCPFHPSCSVFAREAVHRWGVLGLILIVDRLIIREHARASASYPPICRGGRTRWHDPVP